MRTLTDDREQEIIAAYRRREISVDEAARRINAIPDQTSAQWGWTCLSIAILALFGVVIAAVAR